MTESIVPAKRRAAAPDQDFSDALTMKQEKRAAHSPVDSRNSDELSRKPAGATVQSSRERVGHLDSDVTRTSITSDSVAEISSALLGLPTGSVGQAVAWSRVFGQHLVANDYLSVVEVVGHDHSQGKNLGESCESQEVGSVLDGRVSVFSSAAVQARELDPQADVSATAHALGNSEAEPSDTRVVGDMPSVELENALVADQFWAKRALTLTRDPAGTCTAWVRDFDLSGSEVQALAALVKRHAGVQGVSLNRIVINGHEIWRARTEQEDSGHVR